MPNNTPEPFESSMEQYLMDALQMRVYPSNTSKKAVNVYPRIVYTIISGSSDLVMSGPSGLAYKTIQFDCYAKTDVEAATLREQLRYATQGRQGMMGSTLVINVIWRELPGPWEAGVSDIAQGTYRRTVEIKFSYVEYVPRFDSMLPVPQETTRPFSLLNLTLLAPPFNV